MAKVLKNSDLCDYVKWFLRLLSISLLIHNEFFYDNRPICKNYEEIDDKSNVITVKKRQISEEACQKNFR